MVTKQRRCMAMAAAMALFVSVPDLAHFRREIPPPTGLNLPSGASAAVWAGNTLYVSWWLDRNRPGCRSARTSGARSVIPFVGMGEYPVRGGNAVRLLVDGVPAFRRICDAIDAAERSVWVTVAFMWSNFEMPDASMPSITSCFPCSCPSLF